MLQYAFISTDLPNGKTNIAEIFMEQMDNFSIVSSPPLDLRKQNVYCFWVAEIFLKENLGFLAAVNKLSIQTKDLLFLVLAQRIKYNMKSNILLSVP